MKDLYRCLDEYPAEMLAGLARAWHVELPKAESRDQATSLAEAMLAPGALDALISELSPAAREALATVVAEGGAVPGHRLALRHGAIRRLGPSRLAREEPWARPANAVEELYYRGLIVRTYGTVGEHYGEVFAVPDQILARVPPLEPPAERLAGHEVPPPAIVRSDGAAMVEDLLAVMAHIRQQRVGPQRDEGASPHVPPIPMTHIDLGSRLLGGREPDRLDLLRCLVWHLKLVYESRGTLRPTPRARAWLRLDDVRRHHAVVLAWRDDPHWDELERVPTIRQEDPDWGHNPAPARRVLLEFLARYGGAWRALDGVIADLKRDRPDYLRPDGDYDSWHLRDATTGAYLSGFEAWDRIEGALARFLLTHPLHWLGVVEIGEDAEGQPAAFRLTPLGEALLAERPAPDVAPQDGQAPLATIDDDMVIAIPVAGTMYERYQLERFSNWLGQDDVARYAITEDSVWRSYNTGVKTDQIDHFLQRLTGDRLPGALTRNLLAWGSRFGRASMQRVVLLQTVDEATMKQIRGRPELRRLLGELMGPTTCLVEARHANDVLERLKAMGIWPRLVGESLADG
jgi:hypothetical protein